MGKLVNPPITITSDILAINGKTYRPKMSALNSSMSLIDKVSSVNISGGGTCYAICMDDNYIYVAITNTVSSWAYIKKINKLDNSLVATSPIFGSSSKIYCMTMDDNYIYVAGSGTNTVKKYSKSTLALVAESSFVTNTAYFSILVDDTYVYAGVYITTTNFNYIYKYNKSDMSTVTVSSGIGDSNNILCMALDPTDTTVFYEAHNMTIVKRSKSTLAILSTSISLSYLIKSMLVNADYIYIGNTNAQIQALSRSDLGSSSALVSSTIAGSSPAVLGMCQDEEFIYAVGQGFTYPIIKIAKNSSALNVINTSPSTISGTSLCIASDGNYLYTGHQNNSFSMMKFENHKQIIGYEEVK